MAICHSVIPEYNQETMETIYNSSSPDESALVNGANFLGCQFLDRNEENLIKIKPIFLIPYVCLCMQENQ